MIVVRYQGHAFVFALSCPHQNYALNGWTAITASTARNTTRCTKRTGATYPAARPGRRDGEAIVVNVHKWFESDKDPNGWNGATIAV